MLGDIFIEKIVQREMTAGTRMLRMLVVVGALAVLLSVLIIPYTIMYAPLAAVLLFFLCRYLIQRLSIEFEYQMNGADLSVDILVGQRQRKQMLSLKATDIILIQPAQDFEAAKPQHISMTYDAASLETSDERWIAQFQKSKKVCILIFEPDERMLDSLRRYNPSAFQK